MGGKIVTGRNKDQDRGYQDEEGRLIVQEVQEQDGGVVSCILFTDRHELIANSALKIGIVILNSSYQVTCFAFDIDGKLLVLFLI